MASGAAESSNVPQWKRDLIQRRRQQQNKQSSSNGVKPENNSEASRCRLMESNNACSSISQVGLLVPRTSASVDSASAHNNLLATGVITAGPVACNMRLEAEVPLCVSEDPPKLIDKDCRSFGGRKASITPDKDLCVFAEFRKVRVDDSNGKKMSEKNEECESDSSEELMYGPGIVNRLKSKYLNLTLREGTKPRSSVQRFRRAASLEDLLDCDDDVEKTPARKFAKKISACSGVAAKSERYRNANRGNESMKRARSVETLMRYQGPVDDGKLIRQEPVNDHIVLIDRTAVKIESRLVDERPKALNKPKRLKPLLAETERPPPDLVKTTMRLFEGSVKKLKPKGDVAVKIATFKTINDTFKAQTNKNIVPKPPIQPKPFINGTAKTPGSPKKIILKPEIIENTEEQKNNSVVTEPIVQSVSLVVSKFQQIEKSHSPSPSPDSTLHMKLKFSPTSSPEPPLNKFKDTIVKSPPLSSPVSSKNEFPKQCQSPINPSDSPIRPASTCEGEINPLAVIYTEEVVEKEVLLAAEMPDNEKQSKIELVAEETDGLGVETVDGRRIISKVALENIGKAGSTMLFNFNCVSSSTKSHLPGVVMENGENVRLQASTNGLEIKNEMLPSNSSSLESDEGVSETVNRLQERLDTEKDVDIKEDVPIKKNIGAISSLGMIKSSNHEFKMVKNQKTDVSPPQKQIGIIRPLVSTKTPVTQQNLSNRELEKNLINRVKSIEQPTKVVVSLKTADEIQPAKKSGSGSSSGGLWDSKPWNQQNNTMVFNFSNRKDVPDYIENDGLIIRRKREKPKVGDGGVIVLDATLDASTTDDGDYEISGGPPSPCDVSFLNDNILINGRSNLSRTPRNHKHRIQFNDAATKTFEYPSETSMLEEEGSSVDGETSASTSEQQPSAIITNKCSSTNSVFGGGLATYTPSKVDLTSEGFELGVTRAMTSTPQSVVSGKPMEEEKECLKTAEDTAAWGVKPTADLLY